MTREPYTYSILRYRHDPVSGEQINVGVLLYAPQNGYLKAEIHKAYGRIKKVFPNVNGKILKQDLQRIEKAFEKLSRKREVDDMFSRDLDALELGHKVVSKDDSALIWSEAGSGLTKDPEDTLHNLHSRFVTQYEQTAQSVARGDADVWKPFRDELQEREIAEFFASKTIRSDFNEIEFDHAWKNGKWHCIQPLSFDLGTEDGIQEKAARWVGNMLGLEKADEAVVPYFLIGEPKNSDMANACKRAMEFWASAPLRPKVFSETEMDRLADTLEDKIKSSALD